MPSPEKFRETLTEFAVRQSVIDEIYLGYDGLISKTNKKIKSAFFKHALDVMNEKLPEEQTQKILEANACCKSGARIKASKEFDKENGGLSLEEKLEQMEIVSSPHDTEGRKPCVFRFRVLPTLG